MRMGLVNRFDLPDEVPEPDHVKPTLRHRIIGILLKLVGMKCLFFHHNVLWADGYRPGLGIGMRQGGQFLGIQQNQALVGLLNQPFGF